jgi:putative exporter of polyketide antibiotics
MDDTGSEKDSNKNWFGPKKYGFGIRPTSWQGWLMLILFLIVEVVIVSIAPLLYPSWFTPKQIGSDVTPATWQGWVVTLLPALLLIVSIYYIYNKQRNR